MQPINNLDLIIKLPYILSTIILRNLNIDIPVHNELAPMFKLIQLLINTIQQSLQNDGADDGTQDDQDDYRNDQGV